MTPKKIADKAIARMNKKITNDVFLIIQNDRNFMKQYLQAVEKDGPQKTNQTIGKAVKVRYQLVNIDDREGNPSCTLIQSHQRFQ